MKYYLNLENLSQGGFAPAWYKENFSSFGNKNQAGDMTNIDCTNVTYIQQAPGLANLTNNGLVTTLIKGILGAPSTTDTTYGIGGTKLYQFSSTGITNNAVFPHTIAGATGEDVCWFQEKLYYSYNGTTCGIGLYNGSFDDDWNSTVPSGFGAIENNVPHQMIGGSSVGVDIMYFANGRYVGNYDGTTFVRQDLDLPTGSEIQSIAWMSDRIWIAANKTTLTGQNKISASIYTWDGNDTTWESEIPLMGKVGGLHVKNGILYLFYQDITNTGGYKLAYLNGNSVVDVANFTGSLPAYYQITDYKDFIIWNSDGKIFAFGSGDKDLPPRLFQFADGGYSTVGGIAAPFGEVVIASTDNTNYRLAKFSGYDTNCTWKSLLFDITGNGTQSTIDSVRFNFEKLESGARLDFTIKNNRNETIYSDTISYEKLGAVSTAYYLLNGKKQENCRIELDYSNSSTSATVKLKNIKINGTIN